MRDRATRPGDHLDGSPQKSGTSCNPVHIQVHKILVPIQVLSNMADRHGGHYDPNSGVSVSPFFFTSNMNLTAVCAVSGYPNRPIRAPRGIVHTQSRTQRSLATNFAVAIQHSAQPGLPLTCSPAIHPACLTSHGATTCNLCSPAAIPATVPAAVSATNWQRPLLAAGWWSAARWRDGSQVPRLNHGPVDRGQRQQRHKCNVIRSFFLLLSPGCCPSASTVD
ncbi:hypothetical protein B0T17DRAFT_66836 [Bombardia bombarda]|uniref:Uncharacterized protein n=1 Tax=Bombardia bombarda TaxID=252184 RepID=A0AA40CEQ4_9PEZI|nr:hypothetical protein B0T17DRAFT_66836 [Bombardia bombarda]